MTAHLIYEPTEVIPAAQSGAEKTAIRMSNLATVVDGKHFTILPIHTKQTHKPYLPTTRV